MGRAQAARAAIHKKREEKSKHPKRNPWGILIFLSFVFVLSIFSIVLYTNPAFVGFLIQNCKMKRAGLLQTN